MAEESSVANEALPGSGDPLRQFADMLRRGDIALALGIVAILVVLILPMPTWLLDISLAFSITLSVLVLMVVLFISRPLEFSAFPTVLLIATILRLSLNMASTRLILAHGHEGPDAAGPGDRGPSAILSWAAISSSGSSCSASW